MAADTPDSPEPRPRPRPSSDSNHRSKSALAAIAATAALVVGGVFALVVGGGGSDDVSSASLVTTIPPSTDAATTSSTSTTSTTTTTTTTTTSTTTTTTTTTTLPPATTIVDAGVPIWPPYEPLPALDGIAALTGETADATITERPILAVKIDNAGPGRPQWGIEQADVIFEENVEQVTRFVALFHTTLPDRAGPVRSARTGDLDILASMNRPILGWSGGNRGVTRWIESATGSGVLVDFTAQKSPCYNRTSSRSSPHNLLLNPSCALDNVDVAGPARTLWAIDSSWRPPDTFTTAPDALSFGVEMDGVRVEWAWDADDEVYRRSQNGRAHLTASGTQITAANVVEFYADHPPSPVDGRSPNPVTVGGGRAVVHRDGVAIEGRWARRTQYDNFTFFSDATGEWIPLDTGTTFVELTRS